MTATELKLDYFMIYDVEDRKVQADVLLQGQFDKRPQKMQLASLDFFANPVSKNKEPGYDKNAHLAWYGGFQRREPMRRAVLENQFGKIRIWIGAGCALLVPTEKLEKGSAFPEALDHYKVYRVLDWDESPQARLKLTDQFWTQRAELRKPLYFAVPVMKQHGEKVYPIRNERAHLLILGITPRDLEKKVRIQNQVNRRASVAVVRSEMLAVPSLKREWKLA